MNFIPCNDTHPDDDIVVEISIGDNAEHDHCGLELCSPFCNCHCCHIHATYFEMKSHHFVIREANTLSISYHENTIEDLVYGILQPPRYIG
ncbi:hypothetical protein FHK87_24925 [Aquimarina algicola]|uniref:Uncharacterized protein n=1 Tax=Aquimarina algicola TaxID=2589995 RepID=A0A504J4X6_9FLAO|nr:hypothetical protein FHK87_24925 [Aquimarina algicola]